MWCGQHGRRYRFKNLYSSPRPINHWLFENEHITKLDWASLGIGITKHPTHRILLRLRRHSTWESTSHTKKHNTDAKNIIIRGEKQNEGLDPRRNFPTGPGATHLAVYLSLRSLGHKIQAFWLSGSLYFIQTKEPCQHLILLGVCCLGELPSHDCDWKLLSGTDFTQFCPWTYSCILGGLIRAKRKQSLWFSESHFNLLVSINYLGSADCSSLS